MRRLLLLVLLFCAASGAQAALPGLSDVLSARNLLAPGTWSKVLRLELKERAGVYPKSFYALVFEAASVLWIYSPQEGTQSLSTHIGRTESDKPALEPLLREVHGGLAAWQAEEPVLESGRDSTREPANACFVQSLALLEQRRQRLGPPERASLFTYYVRLGSRLRGHTVLLFVEQGRAYVCDPAFPEATVPVGEKLLADKKALGRMLAGGGRTVQVRDFPLPASLFRPIPVLEPEGRALVQSAPPAESSAGEQSQASPRLAQGVFSAPTR